jgi:hypothetical protein
MSGEPVIDIEQFRVKARSENKSRQKPRRKPAVKPTLAKYLKGPVDMYWLGKASCLPGKALHVAIALWHVAGMRKSHEVRMQGGVLSLMGITRQAYSKGLAQLEGAKLISVERSSGRTPVVTLLDLN